MDTLHRLFSGQGLKNRRWWLVLGAFVILLGIARPLVCNSAGPQPSVSPTAAPAPAPTPAAQTRSASAPAESEKLPSLLDTERKGEPITFPTEPSAGSLLWRMLGSLAVVIGLIVAAWIVFRRHLPGRVGATGGRQVALLESTRVGARQNLLLVQAGTRKYLLAATPERISLVADVTEACGKNETPSA